MTYFADKTHCSGCNACAEICPRHCIRMQEDRYGFLYPVIESELCIGCGLCGKICPVNSNGLELHSPIKTYAAWNKNENQHIQSASGGIAYLLSSYIINKGGIVYGCAADGLNILHIRVSRPEALQKLQGSKYVQSNIQDLFKTVKKDLSLFPSVMFIGTPCQIAGLKSYIGEIPDNMYLIDLVCHGVPSQKMLNEHVRQISKGRTVSKITFRSKNRYIFNIKGEGFEHNEDKYWKDKYMKAFMEGITFRPSCYTCLYAGCKRGGDISIGDFWGLKDSAFPPELGNGVSLVLPCTDKGEKLLEEIRDAAVMFERDLSEAVEGNTQLQHPSKINWRVKLFQLLYPIFPFDISVMAVTADLKVKSLLRLIFKS